MSDFSLDEDKIKIDNTRKVPGFEPIDVVDERNRSIAKHPINFKKLNMLAMVASLPVLAGLVLAVAVIKERQEIRKQAQESVSISAESWCVGTEAVVRVDAMTRDKGYQARIENPLTKEWIDLGELRMNVPVTRLVETGKVNLEAGEVRLELTNNGFKIEMKASYDQKACQANGLD